MVELISYLINAGTAARGGVHNLSVEDWDKIMFYKYQNLTYNRKALNPLKREGLRVFYIHKSG